MKVPGLQGSIYQRGGVWWVKYYQHGRPIRESAGAGQGDAEKLLLKRTAAIEEGRTIRPQVNRCKVDALFEMVVTDYRVNGKRSLGETERRIRKHLTPFFGGRRAIAISSELVMQFVEKRQAAGAANGEINRELAILRRGYSLGHKARKIDDAPCFDLLVENNVRTGFFERHEFETVVSHLNTDRPDLAAILRFAYVTGWRIRSEVLTLQWRQVDFANRAVRLEVGETKNDEGRLFKFTSELEEVLRAQDADTRAVQVEQGRICPWVFHRHGERIHSFYKAWRTACLKSGLAQRDAVTKRIHADRIPHDFRRTAVRNLVRAGIPERVAMMMTGHKTRSVFERYNIVSEGDLTAAAERLDAKLTAERAQFAAGHSLGTVTAIATAAGTAAGRK